MRVTHIISENELNNLVVQVVSYADRENIPRIGSVTVSETKNPVKLNCY